MGDDDADLVHRTERWFLHRGLPHLIEDYRVTEDVFTRSVGVLTLIALLEVTSAARLDWTWWQNTLAVAGGAAVLVGLFAVVNRARGRRPLERPHTVGTVELSLFVLLPALAVLVLGQPGGALATAVGNLVLLAVVYVVTSYGLIPMTRWAIGRALEAIGTIAVLIGRALPLLFALTILVFVNTEAWQVAAALPISLFALTGAMFVAVGVLFLVSRLPSEMRRLDEEIEGGGLEEACRGTPMEGAVPSPAPAAPPLTRRQRANVSLVFLFAQGVQAALVSVTVFAFFTVFGVIAIRPVVIEAWLGDIPVDVLASAELFGHRVELTNALLHVAGFVAFVAGFSFTISIVTDDTYRRDFLADIVGQVRQALGVRTAYLAVRARVLGAEASGGG